MSKRMKDLIKDVERLGYGYDRTNSKGVAFYVHENTGFELKMPGQVEEKQARAILVTAQRQVGVATKDNKRNPAAIRERNAAEHARAAAELERIRQQRDAGASVDTAETRAVEEAYLRAERKFRYWDRLMRGVAA